MATMKSIPLDHPMVVEALTAVNKRAMGLAREIAGMHGLSFDHEMALAKQISDHVKAEYPEAAKFHAEAARWLRDNEQ